MSEDQKLKELCEFMEVQIGKLTALRFSLAKDMRPKLILQEKMPVNEGEDIWWNLIDKLAHDFEWAFSSTNSEDAKNTFKAFFTEHYDISREK